MENKIKHLLKSLSFGILALVSFSCEKEEEKLITEPTNYLTGTWEIAQKGEVVPFNNTTIVRYSDYVNEGDCGKDDYTFKDDLTFEINDFGLVNTACGNTKFTGNYTREGRTVHLPYKIGNENKNRSINITVLTYDKMEFNYLDTNTSQLVFLKLVKK